MADRVEQFEELAALDGLTQLDKLDDPTIPIEVLDHDDILLGYPDISEHGACQVVISEMGEEEKRWLYEFALAKRSRPIYLQRNIQGLVDFYHAKDPSRSSLGAHKTVRRYVDGAITYLNFYASTSRIPTLARDTNIQRSPDGFAWDIAYSHSTQAGFAKAAAKNIEALRKFLNDPSKLPPQ